VSYIRARTMYEYVVQMKRACTYSDYTNNSKRTCFFYKATIS